MKPLLFACAMGLLMSMSGCRTSPPPEFHGRWHAVNRYPAETRAIPLRHETVFAATPLDGTLKRLLERWAKEAGVVLEYGIDTDYTLHAPVSRLRAGSLADAVSGLDALYRMHGVAISVTGDRVVVSSQASVRGAPAGEAR